MADILGVGIATLDIINTVSHYPREDEEIRALTQRICRGGNATNTLTVLAQAPHRCFWAGVLCDDNDVRYIIEDLQRSHINLDYCKRLKQGKIPTSYITLNRQTGSRTIVHYRDLPELRFADFANIPLERFDWVHFEARDIAENRQMIAHCKNRHPAVPVSLEIEKPRKGIDSILQAADIYLYSRHFAKAMGV